MVEKLHKEFGPIVRIERIFPIGDMVILLEPDQFDPVIIHFHDLKIPP